MKKIFVTAVAVLIMTVAVTGCGAKEGTGNSSSTGTDAVVVVDPKEMELVPTQEILDADLKSCKVQLGNDIVFELPITLEQLMDKGATIPDDVNPVNEIVPKNGGKAINVTINNNTYELYFGVYGDESRLQLKDCSVVNASTNQMPCVLPKGIKEGSTVEEMKGAYGEPESEGLDYCDYELVYDVDKKSSNGNSMQKKVGMTISIDIEKQTISKIIYGVSEEEKH